MSDESMAAREARERRAFDGRRAAALTILCPRCRKTLGAIHPSEEGLVLVMLSYPITSKRRATKLDGIKAEGKRELAKAMDSFAELLVIMVDSPVSRQVRCRCSSESHPLDWAKYGAAIRERRRTSTV